MPRRRSRFGALNRQLRAVGGVPTGDGPVSEYYKFLIGQKTLTVPNAISGEARELYNVAVIPFGVSATSTDPEERSVCQMSAYSINGLISRCPLDFEDFGIYTDTAGAEVNPNFFPALIKAAYTRSGATTIENKQSGITGRRYNYTPRRNFSFPFGRALGYLDAEEGTPETAIGNVDELDASRSLLRWLSNGSQTATPGAEGVQAVSVSYDAEIYKPASSNPDAPTSAISGVTVS